MALGANYSSELIFIETYAPQFIGLNKFFLGSVFCVERHKLVFLLWEIVKLCGNNHQIRKNSLIIREQRFSRAWKENQPWTERIIVLYQEAKKYFHICIKLITKQ